MGGGKDRGVQVSEYNPRTNTWRNMPSLQKERHFVHMVCTLDNKIFVLGGDFRGDPTSTCEMLDLSDNEAHWRFIASSEHYGGVAAVVVGRKIYVLVQVLRCMM